MALHGLNVNDLGVYCGGVNVGLEGDGVVCSSARRWRRRWAESLKARSSWRP